MSCIIEEEYKLTVKTNKGNLITESFKKEFEVSSYTGIEECHGYHDIVTPNEIEACEVFGEFLDGLTVDDAIELFWTHIPEALEEDEFIVELVEAR